MRIGMRHIRYFVAVAEELHFRRAAERLHIAQPALSRAIRHLEGEVGVRLLDRGNRQVALTAAGAAFLDGCRRSLAVLDGAIGHTRRLARGEAGHLSVGYTDMAINGCLPAILAAFKQGFPAIEIEPTHGVTALQQEWLATGRLDFGFLTGPMRDPGLDGFVVQNERFIAVLYESHPLAARADIALEELSEEDFITGTPDGWEHYNAHFLRICAASGFTPRVVQHAFNTAGIFGLVACGMGITIQSEGVVGYLREGLVVRPLRGCDALLPTYAAWRREPLTPLKRRFTAFLEDYRV